MAFSKTERDRHYLHGLLPPAYMNQDMQVQCAMLERMSKYVEFKFIALRFRINILIKAK